MSRHLVIVEVEDPTICVACQYPAASCICEEPAAARRQAMAEEGKRAGWAAALYESLRRIWTRKE